MVNPAGGMNAYWEMPFRKSARLTIENLGTEEVVLYYQIDYTLTDVPTDAAYFHVQWRRSNPRVLSILKGSTLSLPRHFWSCPRSSSLMGLTAPSSVLACIAGISWIPFALRRRYASPFRRSDGVMASAICHCRTILLLLLTGASCALSLAPGA